MIIVKNKETCKDAIIFIGKELIKRAEDISNDIERVSSIEIFAKINPDEAVNMDVIKNYIVKYEKEELR